ncbi:hypothetical protein L1987_35057 [Smallanthus sonchifolius]|uniref:Uncharacterized protein n=1 Tax=Smallanthus sonchifolius TaxID=185202 RepID=A0ACB9HVI8_9ASTR|nr:hypothetical protein L1987_35057 [Smallanthus sonchifolius]
MCPSLPPSPTNPVATPNHPRRRHHQPIIPTTATNRSCPRPLTTAPTVLENRCRLLNGSSKGLRSQTIQAQIQTQSLFSSVRSLHTINPIRSLSLFARQIQITLLPLIFSLYRFRVSDFQSVIMADVPGSPAGGSHESGGEQSPHSNSNIREQDRFLPIANISRIMKKALPANGKIAKDAKDTVQECVSEFISFVTSEASDKCLKEKRKTINGDDLLWAMATLGFEDYIEPLKAYLSRYREGDTKGSARGGDGSGKKDTVGSQIVPNAQYTHQGSYTQGMNYLNSHV